MALKIMPISDLRRNTSEVLSAVQQNGDIVYITQYGRPAAVLIDFEYYESMLAQLEDLVDIASLAAAEDEPERDYNEFLVELGHNE